MVTCPHCSQQMEEAPELAGQFVACPHCGQQFPLAPPAPRSVWRDPPTPLPVATPVIRPATPSPQPSSPPDPPLPSRDEFAFDTNSPVNRGRRTSIRDRVADEYRRAKRRPTKLPKFFLLAATIIWPIGGWLLAESLYYVQFAGLTYHEGTDTYELKHAEVPRTPGDSVQNLFATMEEMQYFQDGQKVRLRANAAWQKGWRIASETYAIVALICLAWWFYAKE